MEGMTYLAVAYLGMLVAIALWTWTVTKQSRRLDERLKAMERAVATAALVEQPHAESE